jgi:hypothetical protein
LGTYRIYTALLQQGINLSPSTYGCILALNRKLNHLQMPVKRGRPKKEERFSTDIGTKSARKIQTFSDSRTLPEKIAMIEE